MLKRAPNIFLSRPFNDDLFQFLIVTIMENLFIQIYKNYLNTFKTISEFGTIEIIFKGLEKYYFFH